MSAISIALTFFLLMVALVALSGIYIPTIAFIESHVYGFISGIKMPTWNPGG